MSGGHFHDNYSNTSSGPSGYVTDEIPGPALLSPDLLPVHEVFFHKQSFITCYETEDFLFLFHETAKVPEHLEVNVFPYKVKITWRKTHIDDRALVNYFESVGIPYRKAIELCLQEASNWGISNFNPSWSNKSVFGQSSALLQFTH